eukprot:CAMPEP_0115307506 /NCGR_PEP_ID=MMETSP0270-20121206/73180_1 /TAXON_ID=71861 /ORGANISM="Scrippsiella trochoidea, Strain CCMP3099" /LENGTH=38 /DNA_ID= /DNA_START= /DNA_END= /DNA_ORIENTATION=
MPFMMGIVILMPSIKQAGMSSNRDASVAQPRRNCDEGA